MRWRTTLGCDVTAVEISESAAQQSAIWADKQIIGDITNSDTRSQIAGEFDCILICDVLEHLTDPWETLRWSRSKLKSDGIVLASLPNIANYKIRLRLLMGEFEYTDFGILDDSHLRFFTHKTAIDLFEKSGYKITEFKGICQKPNEAKMARYLPWVFSYQFVIHAVVS